MFRGKIGVPSCWIMRKRCGFKLVIRASKISRKLERHFLIARDPSWRIKWSWMLHRACYRVFYLLMKFIY